MIQYKHRFRELQVQIQLAKPQGARASEIILYCLLEDESDCYVACTHSVALLLLNSSSF